MTLPNDHIEPIVSQVHCLTGALYAISDYRNCFVFEYFAGLFQRELFPGDHIFFYTTKIDLGHNNQFFCLLMVLKSLPP